MTQALNDILQREDEGDFDQTFALYTELYAKNASDYEVWKHFYFFLWTAIEDAPSEFHNRIQLRQRIQVMLDDGKRMFSDSADFNFIAGYTVSIFPYEYGNYEDGEKEGQQMLQKTTVLQPDNTIYRLMYLGSIPNLEAATYRQAEIEAAPNVVATFRGAGALNNYFREVLCRVCDKFTRSYIS